MNFAKSGIKSTAFQEKDFQQLFTSYWFNLQLLYTAVADLELSSEHDVHCTALAWSNKVLHCLPLFSSAIEINADFSLRHLRHRKY